MLSLGGRGNLEENLRVHSMRLSEILIDDFLLAAVPGEPFGAEGFVRLSFATSDANIEKGLARFADFVSKLS